MGAGRAVAGLLVVLTAGCVVAPVDPYDLACRDVRRGDLLDALVRLERLPPSHPCAAQARTLAADVRGRMTRALELMRQGLELRGAGQPASAAELFRRARAEWPDSDAARGLLALRADASTELSRSVAAWRLAGLSREPLPPILGPVAPDSVQARKHALALLGREPVPATPRGVARASEPVMVLLPAAPGDVVPRPERPATQPVVQAPPPSGSPQARPVPTAVVTAPKLQRELDAARAAGNLDRAAEVLARIPDRSSADTGWRTSWATMFHRRALVRYGRGDVRGAAADLEQALALTPEDAKLRARLHIVRQELQESQR